MKHFVTVTLPDIGEGVMEGEVIEWLKQEGDVLEQDEPVVIVMTDKATVELPSPYPGTLFKQHHKPGDIAVRDKPLYSVAVRGQISEKEVKRQETAAVVEKREPTSSRKKVLATPATRKLARDMGIDIGQVTGTGKDGRVIAEDLKRQQQVLETTPIVHLPGDVEEPLVGVRRLMAKKMAESKQMIPHFSYHEKVDVTRLIQLRNNFCKEGEKEGVHITYTPFLIKALSLTIKAFPLANSMLDLATHTLVMHQQHNIGIAMSTDLGLIVPVIKNVQEMVLPELIQAFESLKAKARALNKFLPLRVDLSTHVSTSPPTIPDGRFSRIRF